MSAYLWIMAAGSIAIFALYGLYCKSASRFPALQKRAWVTAGLGFLFAAVFGTILARCGYALLMSELDFEYDGIEALAQLLEFEIDHVSFFCGAAGVVLGVLLANRITRKGHVITGMDAFAPFGALLCALYRIGEIFFGSYGAGSVLVEGSGLAFFPFAVKIAVAGSDQDTWRWAVFALSAAFALILAGIVFFRLKGKGRTGFCFTVTLFFLALPQVLCESLRTRGMFWGPFVHAEELLCAVVLLGVMLFWILKSGKGLSFARRWWPLGVLILGAGILVGVEFAIDGKYFGLPVPVCYVIMCAVLAAIGFAGAAAAKRWNAAK